MYRTPACGTKLLGSVSVTLGLRRDHGMPPALIVAMFDGMGGAAVLDSSRPDGSGEYPVLVWAIGYRCHSRPRGRAITSRFDH